MLKIKKKKNWPDFPELFKAFEIFNCPELS